MKKLLLAAVLLSGCGAGGLYWSTPDSVGHWCFSWGDNQELAQNTCRLNRLDCEDKKRQAARKGYVVNSDCQFTK